MTEQKGDAFATRDLYREAGVDIDAGNELVRRIKQHTERTRRPEVLSGIGGFGAGFLLKAGQYEEPVLVSGTDGVGTKLKLAFETGRHDTIGIDAVAMCVNDILAMGAEPLFFLDYFATGKLLPDVAEQVVAGIATGCEQAGAALIGGETAEMPGMYGEGEYDLAGFTVGVVERARVVDGRRIRPGDVLIGLASSGLHSNGYSLARMLVREANVSLQSTPQSLTVPLADALLEPTRIYVSAIKKLAQRVDILGMAHITGGGLLENVPRTIPEPFGCVIDVSAFPVPSVIEYLMSLREIDVQTRYRTWNMGIGFVVIVTNAELDDALETLAACGETAYVIGSVEAGFTGVRLEGLME